MKSKQKQKRKLMALALLSSLTVAAAVSLIRFPMITIKAQAAVLMDAESGKVYYEHNGSQALPPASMSKMMTELLVLDSIHQGRSSWDDPVTASRYAANVTGSEIGLREGDTLTLRQLFEAMVVHSANDAAVAISEHIGGSEKEFVKRMNARAEDIGLSPQAVFANATGLTSSDLRQFKSASSRGETMLSAQDVAKLAKCLIESYPEILNITQKADVSIPEKRITLHTTNAMLPGEPYAYPGNDGFKTGYTERAGYCFTGTTEKDGKRVIAVVMGAPDTETRFQDAATMFDYAFEHADNPARSWLTRTVRAVSNL
ncbi:D-alanyl-D-alanine carboxypeptidase (penicillin-binding protein 5/6) [Paenibacillus rhizosphaerae]|uniref:D-alanyl-D-alanine carboxypeptidase (Penicillin-binding protein 5/6) n=1 Tax=Paenibacillus rhizosphaerae TaxID=297318 RepID=A0A839TK66_9BACL|nr:D-alanyl-D-alanine carboxypeptidase family protein [Paenibacillus rhizosphaerae]MBB3125759.1 D-alanyl-D-alanine carboxypeptidase (penicillin-binding protein 5/6) [Paenibacillus rhizosphaerae]